MFTLCVVDQSKNSLLSFAIEGQLVIIFITKWIIIISFCLQCRGLAPGAYDIAVGGFSDRSVQQRSQGPGWRRAQEVARLAGIPHMLYKEQWNHKKFLVRESST